MRETSFDKSGNLIKEIIFGGFDEVLETYRNYNRFVEYKNGQRNFEYNCEDFVSNLCSYCHEHGKRPEFTCLLE